MSKQILKIERQPWMLKDATHWGLDIVLICGRVVVEFQYKFYGDNAYYYFDNGKWTAPNPKEDCCNAPELVNAYDYFYEITEPAN